MHLTHEDKSNKIEMLRKIEGELWYMWEKRDYITNLKPSSFTNNNNNNNINNNNNPHLSSKPQLLLGSNVSSLAFDFASVESRVDKERKDKRRAGVQEREEALRREKQLKNDEKKVKQQGMVVFKGRPEMQRARKRDLKPKKTDDQRPSQEIVDQMRYLGMKVYEGTQIMA